MRWRIDPEKPFTSEIQSIATTLISSATEHLEQQKDGPHEAVHGARKKFKRIRALYRLVQYDAPAFRKHENNRFRSVARSLSVARDAAALVETVEWMASAPKNNAEADALALAKDALSARRDDIVSHDSGLQDAITRAIHECSAAKEAVLHLDVSDGTHATAKRIAKVWSHQQEKARKTLTLCRNEAGVENFHDLRKSCQIRWMHLGLLRDLWPAAIAAMRDDAKQLVKLLGHEHDLSVLAALADAEPHIFGSGETLSQLLEAIIDRQQVLRVESLSRAETLFRGAPQDEARRMRMLWRLDA